ncbi:MULTISPECIES: hypothetical protein [unclassified Mesorhizobium]|uniref:hypothetical protein n=1 Tax=unclassified Mesorhizobium TaxID=325217 RepID=UPI001093AF71|nr:MULTISPECIES: hypothetical protein [unclassified Mesorhizobium]TGQ77339.1 hypothetical protein EN850_28770 [Mesorhizobium sp. M8A.F.Ca.ET.207.01.1.1]TGS39093.1 hypothetical protein EN825_28475 [Mesorhizobium sp. M8A.F.Ca.ET.182.01.1.1]TGS77374.1 hypothetical protein EN824_28710 [Mesorhizobium sp. M8A.F.Ca.ET.181.01.1.1]TGT36270.1 hypothetical protein EN808_28475 [Mesorhizobium sp. M8A.F.Ca.ET.165.01.1.1]
MGASRFLGQATIEIPQNFQCFVEGALIRLQVQYPSLRFSASGHGVAVEEIPPERLDDLRKNVLHAIYREKIYSETLSLRQALIGAVTAT